MSLWVSSFAKAQGLPKSTSLVLPSELHLQNVTTSARCCWEGGHRDTWPPGLWIVLKAEKDKVKMQKHRRTNGKTQRIRKSLPDPPGTLAYKA